jgi:predicted peptidase
MNEIAPSPSPPIVAPAGSTCIGRRPLPRRTGPRCTRCCGLLAMLVLLASLALAQDPPRAARRRPARPGGANESLTVRAFRGSNGQTIRYGLFVPPREPAASPAGAARLPLVLCLHGAGGNTAAADLLASPAMQRKHPCVVMAPACDGEDARWVAGPQAVAREARPVMRELMEALDAVIRDEGVDPGRVYLTGQSMGGVGTWGLIANHPGRFAAAVPVCGTWSPADAPRMNGVAIWAFHGDMDPRVPVVGSRDMIAALKEAGVRPEPRYTELAGVGHGSWGPAYARAELWDWLFAQRRGAP